MADLRLETKIHIITVATESVQNVIKCVNKAGLYVCDVVLESLASAESVLTGEEKKLWVVLVDFGGETIDLAIFSENNIKLTFVFNLGGQNLTNDLSIALNVPLSEAEKIKVEHGTCITRNLRSDDMIEILGMDDQKSIVLPQKILSEILGPRIEDIFSLIKNEVYRSGMENIIPSGIVITRGTALLDGVTDIVESIFNLPARIGKPHSIRGLVDVVNNPIYATAVGLILHGSRLVCNDHIYPLSLLGI